MIVQLKRKHIKDGVPNHPCKCPVALAVKEATGAKIVFVVGSIEVNQSGKTYKDAVYYKCTKKLIKLISKVDRRKKISPTTFRLIPLDI